LFAERLQKLLRDRNYSCVETKKHHRKNNERFTENTAGVGRGETLQGINALRKNSEVSGAKPILINFLSVRLERFLVLF